MTGKYASDTSVSVEKSRGEIEHAKQQQAKIDGQAVRIRRLEAALRVARGYVLRGKAVPLQLADLKTVDDALCLASESPSA